MYANNEVGTIQPIAEIGRDLPRARHPLPHRRGAGGRLLDAGCRRAERGYAVAVGAQVLRAQGRGRRSMCDSGTRSAADTAARRSATAAPAPRTCPASSAWPPRYSLRRSERASKKRRDWTALRDRLIAGVLRDSRRSPHGHPTERLPNNASFCFAGVKASAAAEPGSGWHRGVQRQRLHHRLARAVARADGDGHAAAEARGDLRLTLGHSSDETRHEVRGAGMPAIVERAPRALDTAASRSPRAMPQAARRQAFAGFPDINAGGNLDLSRAVECSSSSDDSVLEKDGAGSDGASTRRSRL